MPNFVDGEVPADNGDGTFTLDHTPLAGSLRVYLNGVRQAGGDDYTADGATVDFGAYPLPGDGAVLADYRY